MTYDQGDRELFCDMVVRLRERIRRGIGDRESQEDMIVRILERLRS